MTWVDGRWTGPRPTEHACTHVGCGAQVGEQCRPRTGVGGFHRERLEAAGGVVIPNKWNTPRVAP